MGKNKTDKKKIILQDQLYDEILNGFEEHRLSVKIDDSTVRYTTNQNIRIQKVGYQMLQSPFTKQVLWYNLDSIFKFAEQMRQQSFVRYFTILKENEEEDALEGEDVENSLGIWKLIGIIDKIRTTIQLVKAGKKIYDDVQDFVYNCKAGGTNDKKKMKNVIETFETSIKAIIDGVLPPSLQAIIKLADAKIFDRMWDGFVQSIIGSAGEAAAWAAVGFIAAKLTAGVGGVIVGGVRAAQVSARIAKIYNKLKKLYKVSKLIYRGTNIALTIADIIHWEKEDERKLEEFIDREITQPHLIGARDATVQKLANLNPAAELREAGALLAEDISSFFVNTDQVANESEEDDEPLSFNRFSKSRLSLNFSNIPDVDRRVSINYADDDLDYVLDDVYGVKLTDNAKNIINQLPTLVAFRRINQMMIMCAEFVMNRQLKLITYLSEYKIPTYDKWETEMNKWGKFESNLIKALTNQLNDVQKQELHRASLENTEDYDKRYEEIEMTWLINNARQTRVVENHDNNGGFILNQNSPEPFRPLFQSRYGYLTGVKIDITNENKNANGYDFLTNEITFNKGDQAGYDVRYIFEEGKYGYKGYTLSNMYTVSYVSARQRRSGEDASGIKSGQSVHEHGYTTLMENFFYLNIARKEELQVEESISSNIDKLYNILTTRVVA